MNILLGSGVILLPLLLIRILQRPSAKSFYFGVCSDLFFIAQSFLPLWLLAVYLPSTFNYMFGAFLWALPMLSLADVLLMKNMGIRFRFTLLHHARSAPDFLESAISLGLYKWLLLGLVWCGIVVTIIRAEPSLFQISFADVVSIAILLASSGASFFLLERNMAPMLIYKELNLLILEEKEILSCFFKKRRDDGQIFTKIEQFLPDCEQSFFVDKTYPLLRITNSFHGPTHFSRTLTKNESPHVIFLCLESFRASGIPSLDSFRPIQGLAPHFERLSKEGMVWRNFYSTSTRSCKALLSTLFGIHPQVEDEIFSHNPTFALRGLPDMLKERGYRNTYLHNGDINFDRQQEFLLSHGFDTVCGRQDLYAALKGKVQSSSWGVHDEYLMRYARDFLFEEDKKGEACFLYLFTVSNHHPWKVPDSFAKQSLILPRGIQESPFLQTMQYTDYCLGWFVEQLRSQGLLEKSLIFIFGDHGQPLGEHTGSVREREGIYEESVKVPLLLLGQGIRPGCIDEVASQIDLLPTLLDLFDSKTVHHSVGRSLKRKKAETEALVFSPFFPKLMGCRKEQWKLIHNPISKEDELFDLEQDPGETTNLAHKNKGLTEELRAKLIKQRAIFEALYQASRFSPQQNNLKEFNLTGRSDLEDDDLFNLLNGASPSVLLLEGCLRISDRGLAKIAPHCAHLIKLSLKDCPCITEKGLQSLAAYTKQLKIVDLSNCLAIDFQMMAVFWQKVPFLQKLILCHQPFLTDDDVHILMDHVGYLESLEIPQSALLTDRSIFALSGKADSLTFFSCDCSQITETSMNILFAKTKQLRGFSIASGKMLTDRLFHGCRDLPISSMQFVDCPRLEGRFLEDWPRLFLHTIHFSDMPSIGDETLHYCATHALRNIYLQACPLITNKGVNSLDKVGAKEIHLLDCPGVTRDAIENLRKTIEQVFWRS